MIVFLFLCTKISAQDFEVQAAETDFGTFTFANRGHDWTGLCAEGKRQSPIDIVTANTQIVSQTNSSFSPLEWTLQSVQRSGVLEEETFGLRIYASPANSVTQYINGREVSIGVLEYHILAPAEHLLNGIRHPFSVKVILTITHPDDSILIYLCMELFFKEGRPNAFLQSLIDTDGEVSVESLLPANHIMDDYFYYSGSADMPWPVCTEDIGWVIPNYVLEASPDQINYWASQYIGNLTISNGKGVIRDVQPLNDRVVYHFVSR